MQVDSHIEVLMSFIFRLNSGEPLNSIKLMYHLWTSKPAGVDMMGTLNVACYVQVRTSYASTVRNICFLTIISVEIYFLRFFELGAFEYITGIIY